MLFSLFFPFFSKLLIFCSLLSCLCLVFVFVLSLFTLSLSCLCLVCLCLVLVLLILGNLGSGHRHICGIPQGCPFSMVFTALLMRPWMMQVLAHQGIPRWLADDLLFFCQGPRSLRLFSCLFFGSFSYTFLIHFGYHFGEFFFLIFGVFRKRRNLQNTHGVQARRSNPRWNV